MRNINTYIIEKFKISKDIQLSAEAENEETIKKVKELFIEYIQDNFKYLDIISVKVSKGNIYFKVIDEDGEGDMDDIEKICVDMKKILIDNKLCSNYGFFEPIEFLEKSSSFRIHPNWVISKADFDKRVFRKK